MPEKNIGGRIGPVLCLLIFSTAGQIGASPPALQSGNPDGRIRVHGGNPWYWEYEGQPVLLLGGSDEDNLFNHPDLLRENLAVLAQVGGNYIRSTLSSREAGNAWPYVQRDGRYDLTTFNAEYFDRLEQSCREARVRGIILQIEIWATFDYYREYWDRHPFNPANNVNYSADDTHLVAAWDHLPARKVQPFFHSPPGLNHDRVLLRYQEAFVRKVLDATIAYPNVLYCLDNETDAPPAWALYWGEFIRQESVRRGVLIHLTEMYDPWDILSVQHETTWRHPKLFSFADVSQNNWLDGRLHYDRLIGYREILARQGGGARPMNNVKIYARRYDGQPTAASLAVRRWWRSIFAGCAAARFHRPDSGPGINATAQQAIRAARTFFGRFDIFGAEPRPDLRFDDGIAEAYVLARPGEAYAVYFPAAGHMDLTLEIAETAYRVAWFDPGTAEFTDQRTLPPAWATQLRTPTGDQPWIALIDRP